MPKRNNPFVEQQSNYNVHKIIFTVLVAVALVVTGRTIASNHDKPGSRTSGVGSSSSALEEAKSSNNKNKDVAVKSSSSSSSSKAADNSSPPIQLKIYKTLPPLSGGAERKIMLIHIGRGGGMTFSKNTAVGCLDNYYASSPGSAEDFDKQREECLAKFPNHNKLAQLTQDVVHATDRGGQKALRIDDAQVQAVTSFLVILRDPVERIISSYRYSHPGNCEASATTTEEKNYGCTLMEKSLLENGSLGYTIYKKCFPSPAMEDFAQAILPPFDKMPQHWSTEFTSEEIGECRKLARQMVAGTLGGGDINPHMEANYGYFSQATYKKYPDKELFAIRTEQILQDMKRVDRLIGGQGKFQFETANIRTGGSKNFKPSPLSDSSLHKLCCVLEKELNVYFDVFGLSKNMEPNDRLEANMRLRSTCGLWDGEAWIDWRKRCWKAMEEPMV